MATSTQRAYSSAHRRYLSFCTAYNVSPTFPLSENTLCYFVAYLHTQALKHQTIKSYLSGIRHAQIALGFSDPFAGAAYPRLEYVLKGVKRSQAEAGTSSKPHLPVTPEILQKMFAIWNQQQDRDACMLQAACCLGFFGFLRAAEFTIPSWAEFDEGAHLTIADVAVDNKSAPTIIQVHIKQSKTDPFRQGVFIYIGKSHAAIYPVALIIKYLTARGSVRGPLFLCADGSPLSRTTLVAKVRAALAHAGVDSQEYSGHSFHIGAATTAAKKGVEDSLIQILGRWQSSAYLHYVKIPREQLATISQSLIR